VMAGPTWPDWVPRWPPTAALAGSSDCPCFRWLSWDLRGVNVMRINIFGRFSTIFSKKTGVLLEMLLSIFS
jgi:hypothetical protein